MVKMSSFKTSSFARAHDRVNVMLVLVVIFLLIGFFLFNMWSKGSLSREGLASSGCGSRRTSETAAVNE